MKHTSFSHVNHRAPPGSRYAPIDLTAPDIIPSEARGTKRKDSRSINEPEPLPSKKQKVSRRQDEEKRAKKYRLRAPLSYADIRARAMTQRMFVIDRVRHCANDDSPLSHPTETISLAGTTGNIYTITIDKVPSCDCPHAKKGNQCKHIVYVLARVLRAPPHLEYQLAFLSSELREIFARAPPLPTETGDGSAKDGKRKSMEGEDCPICMVGFDESSTDETVYCKAACGNNIHQECFAQWAATKQNGVVTCPFCRAHWQSDASDVSKIAKRGKKNAEGYVNIAGQLGLSGRRDYSTYNEFWLRQQGRRVDFDWEEEMY
jgi:hypothetical protein